MSVLRVFSTAILLWVALFTGQASAQTERQDPVEAEAQRIEALMREAEAQSQTDPVRQIQNRVMGYAPTDDEERITHFDTVIDVDPSGILTVTETIDLVSAAKQIRRGIFRELPASYRFMGVRQDYDYQLLGVTRNGEPEPVTTLSEGNAVTWRIGSGNVYLEPGPHTYEIRYRVGGPIAVRRHSDKDEVYWNATGTYWAFPIERATATINFPPGADILEAQAYTGGQGTSGSNYRAENRGDTVDFQTTRALRAGEGLTVAASIAPGIIEPMSEAEARRLQWIRWGGVVLLSLGGLGLLGYYYAMWNRVGRDPAKPPVFPRYAPPKGYSAAAVHHIHHKGLRGMDALSALVMQMGAAGQLQVEAEKKTTRLTRLSPPTDTDGKLLIKHLFGRERTVVMDGEPDSALFKGATGFMRAITERYSRKYYTRNLGWAFLGILLSIALVVFVMVSPVSKNGSIVVGLFLAIAALNFLFLRLLPAPTDLGNRIGAEIEGFKLYLETAEADRINTANPLGERPPAMTAELYERFMPYAIALGVEKPWTKQFERTLPREAAEYRPSYASGSQIDRIGARGRPPVDFGDTIAKAMTAGVAAAAPVSQSSSSGGFSSGSGGGGFSGGGGGGGGGGGW